MQFPKNRIFELSLMEAVKHQPVLYDRDSPGYSNKQDIDRAWDEVLAEVRKEVKDVNVTHCKLRWRSLRDRYVKQFIKTTNGAIVEPDLSKWAYNAQLDFLRKHLKKRKFVCEKPTSPKKMRAQPVALVKRFQHSPQQQDPIIFESITKSNESFSDSSTAYEQNIQVEIDSLENYECPMEDEISEIEFVQLKDKDTTSITTATTIKQQQVVSTENPIPEVSNEVVLDEVDGELNRNTESIDSNAAANEQLSSLVENTSTEECINNLIMTVNNLLKEQQAKDAQKSPNDEYFKVLDDLLKKLPADEVDKVKVDILNFVVNKTKALNRRSIY